MRVVVNDFAGHGFTLDLADALQETVEAVSYAFCAGNLAPHADFGAANVEVVAVQPRWPFEKYDLVRRTRSEIEYGVRSASHAIRYKADAVVVSNMPIVSALIVWGACLLRRSQRILWLQDLQSGLAGGVLGESSLVARLARKLEALVVRSSTRVLAISDRLGEECLDWGLHPDRLKVLPNWPAVDRLPMLGRTNRWSAEQGLDEHRLRFLYSGTLAKKHTPALLLDLAQAAPQHDLVVVSEGDGANWLSEALAARQLDNVHLFPYQPFDRLAEVLASGDILVGLLNEPAGNFSVPSKFLSYLCAGRPILASMPSDNDATRMVVDDACAGIVTDPATPNRFVEQGLLLMADAERRHQLGANARHFAEQRFSRDSAVRRFAEAAGLFGQ